MDPILRLLFTLWVVLLLVIATQVCKAGEIEDAALEAGQAYNVNPKLILAVIEVESGFNPDAVGSLGEVGLMQLRPEFHEGASFDVRENVFCGTANLARMRVYCKSDCDRFGWVALHNTGPRRIANKKERDYYRKVMRAFQGRD